MALYVSYILFIQSLTSYIYFQVVIVLTFDSTVCLIGHNVIFYFESIEDWEKQKLR